MKVGSLNVGVRSFTQTSHGPNGKRVQMTEIFVRMGDTVIASRITRGKWDERQALQEFKRFPERFPPREGWTKETVKAIAA